MENKVQIGNKKIDICIIQGGMGVGVSLGNLAGAVMKEGGMGVISAAHPGYRRADFYDDVILANCEAIHEEVAKAKDIAKGKGLCGVNVMVASKNYEIYVKAAIDAGADAIISGAGLPMDLPSIEGSEKILLAPIVSSGRAARLILKSWSRHYHRLPDFIVIEGAEAGGHLGFKKADLIAQNVQSLEEILHDVIDEVKLYDKKIPIFVAGGVYDHRDILHFLALGASGVQIATRFIATYECDGADQFKQKIIDATKADIQLVDSPTGLPGRAIMSAFMEKTANMRIPSSHCINCMKPCNPSTTPYCISDALIHAVKGDIDQGLVFAGSNAYRVNRMMHVHDLIMELLGEEEVS